MNILSVQELTRLGGLLYESYCNGEGYKELTTKERILSLSAQDAWVLMSSFMIKRESMFRDTIFSMQDHVETFWAMVDELN